MSNVLDAKLLNRSQLLFLFNSCARLDPSLSVNYTFELTYFGPLKDVFQPHWLMMYNFFFDVILVGTIMLAGVTGNVLSCCVLLRDRSHGTTSLLLTSLAICDTLFLIACLFFQFLRTLALHILWIDYMNLYAHISKVLYGSGQVVRMIRNWTVVLVSMERWVAVCMPLHAPSICTRRKARISISLLCLLCTLYSIPNFFIVDAITLFCSGCNSIGNSSENVYHSMSQLPVGVVVFHSATRKWVENNYLFRLIYRLIGYTIVIVFLPTLIIAILNVLLIRGIKYANARRAQIMARIDCANRQLEYCSCQLGQHPDRPSNHVPRLTTGTNGENHAYFVRMEKSTRSRTGEVNRLCVGVIMIYLLCELPAVGYQVIHLLQHRRAIEIAKPVTNALVCLNSGVNFFVYVFLGRRFRSQLKSLFRRHVCCACHYANRADHEHGVTSAGYHSSLLRICGSHVNKDEEVYPLSDQSNREANRPVDGGDICPSPTTESAKMSHRCSRCLLKGKSKRARPIRTGTNYSVQTSVTEI
ncbi:hypothetical protein EG68_00134 [Paragonimus skrjabini miyazakii]|uniref:G-protein coupled receptors family 1 profile domain-containing protein n=1 Tax=Paragonimus skrjabini miyazakii TaxID=59628 RepID=A0A8S9ZCJ3_9TREM|nr:hypothetical protein EG68_00134 [Paragonimus skrjabini miyazakii]